MRRVYPGVYPAKSKAQVISLLAGHSAGIAFVRPRAEHLRQASYTLEEIYGGVSISRREVRRTIRELQELGLVEVTQTSQNTPVARSVKVRYRLNLSRVDDILPFLQYTVPVSKSTSIK